MEASQAVAKIQEKFGEKVQSHTEFRGEHTLVIAPEALVEVCKFAKEELGFNFLSDICSVDHYGEEPRFEVVYHLYSLSSHNYLRLKTRVPEEAAEVDSVVEVWATANWHEREVWDMMGIRFRNHPDLRRILMWEGYPYHPLRKDFPLAGLPSEMPEVAFSGIAPLEGGPFVTSPTTETTVQREPRARPVELPESAEKPQPSLTA